MPDLSPYCFADNSPILLIDKNGENPVIPIYLVYQFGRVVIQVVVSAVVANEVRKIEFNKTQNRSDYKWQEKQRRIARELAIAQRLAIAKMIEEQFGGDPNEPKFNNKSPKGPAIVLLGLALLHNMLNIEEKQLETQEKQNNSYKDEINKLQSKSNLSESDKKKFNNYMNKLSEGQKKSDGLRGAIEVTNGLIKNEELAPVSKCESDATSTEIKVRYIKTEPIKTELK